MDNPPLTKLLVFCTTNIINNIEQMRSQEHICS